VSQLSTATTAAVSSDDGAATAFPVRSSHIRTVVPFRLPWSAETVPVRTLPSGDRQVASTDAAPPAATPSGVTGEGHLVISSRAGGPVNGAPSALSATVATADARAMRALDIMSRPVYGVTGDASIEEAAALMLDRGFTTLPVVTAGGHLRGLVTEGDLGRARFTSGARGETTPEGGAITGLQARAVCDVMREKPATVRPDAQLSEVATAMVDAHQRCLPVTDVDGKVVGMISWRDLLVHLVPGH